MFSYIEAISWPECTGTGTHGITKMHIICRHTTHSLSLPSCCQVHLIWCMTEQSQSWVDHNALNQQLAIQHVSHYYGTSNPKSNICHLNNCQTNSMSHSFHSNQVSNQFSSKFSVQDLKNLPINLLLLKEECFKDEVIVFRWASWTSLSVLSEPWTGGIWVCFISEDWNVVIKFQFE